MKTPSESIIQSVLEVYQQGRTIDALNRATEFAPLKDWAGVRGCSLASRIAINAGGSRLADRLAIRAWREDKSHPLAQFEYGAHLLQRRGPLGFWLITKSWPAMVDGTPEWRADFFALKSFVAGQLRDFHVAELLIDQAESLAPTAPWVHLQRAHLLERLEKVDEALEIASAACKLHPHPFYRPGAQAVAHFLQLLDRDDEAIQLLRGADAALQNGPLAAQLYCLLADTQQWAAAEQSLERYAALTPLREPPVNLWLQSQRARVAYHLGKRTVAYEFAKGLHDPFHRQFAEKLAQPPSVPEALRLDVPFVRQHFKTCAPATLAALGRFWNISAEHLALVEAICYDGTPSWRQREWAERNGWLVREFRVDWESSLALLTQGIPFAISTVEATSAHMQAVIGFDRTRGALLLRDPSQPYCLEAHAEQFFERYRPFGPRGVVFLPLAETARLSDINLRDSEFYDDWHVLSLALSNHNRKHAQAALAHLESKSPEHPVTWEARLELAAYDANTGEEVRCLDHLLELFPANPARLIRRLGAMRDATREERVEFLERSCASKAPDPALFVGLARNLMADAPRQPAATQWLRRAMRARPMDSSVMVALAELRWWLGRFDEATELFQFAAAAEGYREPLYQSWFAACRQVRQTDAALLHLEDRFRRFGNRSSQPALTLAWALCEVEQPERARKVLAEAIQLRADDGYLIIRAAGLNARLGAGELANSLLDSAKGKVRENDWLRTAVELTERRFDAKSSLQFSREILALEPLAVDAHGSAARALNQLEGRVAAVAHLRDAVDRHPHHCGLQRLLIEWSRSVGFESTARQAREFLKISPRDAWTRRELAWALANLNQPDEAVAEAAEALRIEPRNSASPGLLGHIHERFRRAPEARDYFRQAIALSVDNSSAVAGLLRLATTDNQRKQELVFIERELVRQVVRGDGLLAFVESASPILDSEALLKTLREAHAVRPDLWHAWSALVVQLDHLGRYDEALPLARTATERFPHLPRTWLDLATIHHRRNETEDEITASQRAFEINPAWNRAAVAFASALERHRTLNDAMAVYERALRHAASDPQLHIQLASIQWRLRQPREALSSLENALRLAPDIDHAWNLLFRWSNECGRPERPAEFARELTRERPGSADCWLMFAKVLVGPKELSDREKAVNRALELDSDLFAAWDFKAELLTRALQFDAAIEACDNGAVVCVNNAYMLRGRKAWVEAQRTRTAEAIRQMRAVLAENAAYAWGWHQLATWLVSQQSLASLTEAEEAIRHLLKLQPHDAWAHRQLAALRLKQGDKAGAQKVLGAIFESSPTDRFAGENLFNLQLELSNLAGAADTLRRMQTHQPGARTLAHEIILATRTGDQSNAAKRFEDLCAQPDPDSWPLEAAFQALQKAGLAGQGLKILETALISDHCNPGAGPIAIRVLMDKGNRSQAVRLFGAICSPQARARAAAPLAQRFGALKTWPPLRNLLRDHRDVFLKDDVAWGQVGYALVNLNRLDAAAEWLADWRSRTNLESWMLFNLCFALRHLGRYSEANEVVEFAVQKWGYRQQDGADLRLFLAVEKALAGSISEAAENLQRVHVRENVLYDRQLMALAKSLVDFQQLSEPGRRSQFKTVRRQLGKIFPTGQTFKANRDVRQTFRRAGEVFTRKGAGAEARFWFLWRLNWQWAFLPLAVGALFFPPAAVGLLFGVKLLRRPRRVS